MTSTDTRVLMVPTTIGSLRVQVGGPVDGAVALLWPSLLSDGQTSWGTQLAGLHGLGWRTLLVDPPGTGGSKPASRLFTMEECADAAIQILDAASAERAAILGLSWGGFVGLRVALAAPQRVISLVLSNTTARRSTFVERQRGQMNAAAVRIGVPGGPGRLVASTMLSKHTRSTDPEFAKLFAAGVNALDKAEASRAMRSVDINRTSVVSALDRITVPTLVIAGAQDKIFSHAHSDELASRIRGAQLEVIPDVGHIAPSEASASVSALLKRFLGPAAAQSAHPT